MDLKTNTYITVADLTSYIPDAVKTNDQAVQDTIRELINSATDWVNTFLRFEVLEKTVTMKYIEPLASNKIPLKGKFTTLTSISVGGVPYVVDTDCFLDRGIIVFMCPFHPSNYLIELAGKQGWAAASIPSDIITALKELVSWNYMRVKAKGFGVKSRTVGDNQTEFLEIVAPKSITDALLRYQAA